MSDETMRETIAERAPRLPAAVTVLGAIAAAVAVGLALAPVLPRASIPLILLLGVLVAAAAHGVWAGVAAACLASLSFN
ncbi:DUF4118 domain-containing protein, partial [Nostoc sp. NIES-2111]